MARRSIGFPLALGIVLSLMTAALAAGWQVLVVADLPTVTEGLTTLHWVWIVLGSAFFILLILGLVWLCAWLVREMRLNQRQQAFLDAVTHEMKTPLASLRLYVETLARRDPELAAARVDTRSRAPAERFDLSDLLAACADEARLRHELPDSALRLLTPPALPAWGNRMELTMVFRNLLENAIKYSPSPVQVTVRAESSSEDRVRVSIEDRGIGIERKELRKIFQRFYRAGRDVQRQAAGLGLGLFIVRNLVRRQGGRVEASSEGSGQGSRFVVTLRTSPRGETGPARAGAARPARVS
jgi:signal transduction histidine kinase